MIARTLLGVFTLAIAVGAAPGLTAEDVFRRALKGQGAVRRTEIRDVHLRFLGQVVHDEGVNTIERDYWHRAKDRAFRVRTVSRANRKSRSDRGVLGETYWEAGRKTIYELSPGNRDDRGSIDTIRSDRRDFERILHLVLLARLDGEDTVFRFAVPEPVQLTRDVPFSARSILGKDRAAHHYHVLSIERPGEPRLELFIHTKDFAVRKAIQYYPRHPDRAEWFYYFGPYRKSERALNMTLPLFFSVHTAMPTDDESKKATNNVNGEISVVINGSIDDAILKPAAP